MRKLPLLLVLLGSVFAVPLASAQPLPPLDQTQAKALIVEAAPPLAPLIQAAPAPNAARIDVEAALSRPEGRYALGEFVEVRVRVDRPSHVTILNVAPNGAVTILYPNQFNQQNLISPGHDLIAPGPGAVLRVAPPLGREVLKVIASEHPLPLAQLADFRQAGPFLASSPGAAESFAKALVVEAAPPPTPVAAPAPAPSSSPGLWGEQVLIFETYEAAPAPAGVFAPPPVDGPTPGPMTAAPFPSAPVALAPAPQPSGFTLSTNKASYRIGEPVGFWATTDRPCHLTLLAVSSTGRSMVIFPGDPTHLRRILPGGPVAIPDASGVRLTVGGPARQETVIGLCATEDVPVAASGAALLGEQGPTLAQSVPFLSPQALQTLYGSATPPATAQASVVYAVTP